MPRREDHEVRKGHVGHWIKKIETINCPQTNIRRIHNGDAAKQQKKDWL